MNIFVLDRNPILAARFHCDKHVNKMISESCQMFANAFTKEQLSVPSCPRTRSGEVRSHSYRNHPCTKWTLQSRQNFVWHLVMALELTNEFYKRYGHDHYGKKFLLWVVENIDAVNFADLKLQNFVQAMPANYKCEDTVSAYRAYYNGEKAHFAKWKLGNRPFWMKEVNATV